MGFLDGKNTPRTTGSTSCMKGVYDCMYSTPEGGCCAEWCIYNELPSMDITSKEITCDVCQKNKKTVSIYSGTSSFICDECVEELRKLTQERNCLICGVTVKGDQICPQCASLIREKLYNE